MIEFIKKQGLGVIINAVQLIVALSFFFGKAHVLLQEQSKHIAEIKTELVEVKREMKEVTGKQNELENRIVRLEVLIPATYSLHKIKK